MLLGQSEEMVGHEVTESLPVLAAQAVVARRVIPGLTKVQDHSILCWLATLAAGRAAYPRSDSGSAGISRCRGHSGITWSPAAGKLVTELVMTGKPSLPLEPYSLARFSPGIA